LLSSCVPMLSHQPNRDIMRISIEMANDVMRRIACVARWTRQRRENGFLTLKRISSRIFDINVVYFRLAEIKQTMRARCVPITCPDICE
jgi:hypothetical protein